MAQERTLGTEVLGTLARPLALALCLLVFSLAPGAARAQAGAASVLLHWTAPGDDGDLGIATAYEVRYSKAPLDSASFVSESSSSSERLS